MLADWHRYGYTFARGVLEFAKVQKVPTDVENWTAGRRKLDQSTQCVTGGALLAVTHSPGDAQRTVPVSCACLTACT